MSLHETLEAAHRALEQEGIAHALIGGLALGAYGVGRSTADVDLLVDGRRRHDVRKALIEGAGFSIFHESAEMMQLTGSGALDLLLANRDPTQRMLRVAGEPRVLGVPCVRPEDLAGLKIQSLVKRRPPLTIEAYLQFVDEYWTLFPMPPRERKQPYRDVRL